MRLFTREELKTLMDFRTFPSLSFYLPAQRVGADTRQSPVRLKNLLKRAEELLHEKGVRTSQIHSLLRPVAELVEDSLMWEYQENGLALFLHAEGMLKYQLPFPVEESVTLSDHFLIRPLIPLTSGNGTFSMLALGLSETRLYSCTRQNMEELEVEGMPASIKEILSTYEEERVMQHHSSAAKGPGASRGFNPIKENEKVRIEEYLREIDAVVVKHFAANRPPMVVVCVDYLFPLYRAVSHYDTLMDRNVSGSPDTLRPERMLAEAWEIVLPVFGQGRAKAFAQWEAIAGTERVLEGISRILPAAVQGRVEYLLLAGGQTAYGCFDPLTDTVEPAVPAEKSTDHEDLFDLAAAHVFQQGGEVFLADLAELPPGATCLALLRY